MTILYNKEYVERLEKRNRRNYLILFVVAGICILEGLVSCFLIGKYDAELISDVTKATFILGGWICIYYLFANILPVRRKYSHLGKLLRMDFQELQGEVVDVKREFTVAKDIIAYKIVVRNEENDVVVCWNVDFGEPPFSKGQHVNFCVANRFILSYMTEGTKDVT